jgi:uncharacterized protein YbcI
MEPRTKQEIEKAIKETITQFLEAQLGDRLEAVVTQIIEYDAIVVKLKDILPPSEKMLIRQDEGTRLIKELKEKLIEKVKPNLKAVVENLIGVEITDIHSIYNETTGEVIVFLTLKNALELIK